MLFWILRYLKRSLGKALHFSSNCHLGMEAYTDIDCAKSPNDRRSTFEYCAFIGGNLVIWISKQIGCA